MDVSQEYNSFETPIVSLKGIEYFAALRELSCGGEQLTSLDVSNNTALTSLTCDDCQLTSLNVSNNTALTELICLGNQLTTLDVSNNTALEYLECTPMDDDGNNLLQTLYLKTGQEISSLYKPDGTNIERK